MMPSTQYAKRYMVAGRPIELGSLWGFKVFGGVSGLGETGISRYVVAPDGKKVGNEKPWSEGGMAVAMQVRDMVLGMPAELERIKRSVATSNDNIIEYRKQLATEKLFANELEAVKNRLAEVDNLIRERSKEGKEAKLENGQKQMAQHTSA